MTIPSIYYTAIRRNPFIAAYWRLNDAEESPTAIDWGNKYLLNGFYNYNPTKSVSIINNDIFAASRLFSKSEQNVEIPNSTPLENVTTLEAWVVPFEAGQTSCIICKMNSENTKPEPYYLGLKSGKLYYAIGNGAEELVVESKETLAAYGAYYVCGLFDNRRKTSSVIINNVVENSGTKSFEIKSSTEPVFIGALGNTKEKSFSGLIAEPAVYTESISPVTSLEHFNLGRQIPPEPSRIVTYDPPSYS